MNASPTPLAAGLACFLIGTSPSLWLGLEFWNLLS